MSFSTYKQIALTSLKGKWGGAILTCFVAILLGGGIYSVDLASSSSSINNTLSHTYEFGFGEINIGFSLFGIISFILGGAVSFGYARYQFALLYRQRTYTSLLFDNLSTELGKGIVLKLLRTIYIILWTLLFIIPGIIAGLSYSVAPFIMAENPEMSASEAISLSKKVMYGHKMELFVLQLSFIGWIILSAFTFGLGYFVLAPYMESTFCAFYLTITGRINNENVLGFLN